MRSVGLVGYGVVNQAMHRLFPDAVIHDPAKGYDDRFAINRCEVVFIAVPTPLLNGRLDVSIIDDILTWCHPGLIVIRSAVNPGDCDRWETDTRDICNMPEYLGETPAHPLLEEAERKFLIIGGRSGNRRKVIELFQSVYNANINIRQVTNLEAEVIKLSENRAIAFKVAQCQELYDYCEAVGVDYYTIRDAVYGDDPRFNLWWTFIYKDERGFNSKCIPKDVYAWAAAAEDSELTDALLKYNERLLSGKYSNSK